MDLSLTHNLYISTLVQSPVDSFVHILLGVSLLLSSIVIMITVFVLVEVSFARDKYKAAKSSDEKRAAYIRLRRIRWLRLAGFGTLWFLLLLIASIVTTLFLDDYYFIQAPSDGGIALNTAELTYVVILWVMVAIVTTLVIVLVSYKPWKDYDDTDDAFIERQDAELNKLREENYILSSELRKYDSATPEEDEEEEEED